ncbi:alpha-amylase family glycosyl hydrolase [Petrimonas sp.]|uniref:alpha-amylase family glycosyl hydrolase n=1 Tax=Petrimonas sp. TaxID=2023866 RepID=UPI003F515C03
MKKNILFLFLILFALSCGKDPEIDQPVITRDGINLSINNPDADKELTIIYKAGTSSTMYGHDGDVYAHIGIISEGVWQFVPANWDENIAKCKMAKVENNAWSLKLIPTIRQWFSSGETSVTKIGIVIRSADRTKQTEDLFITVTDSKFKAFQPGAVKTGPMPSNAQYGINVVDNSTVTLVLYDKDKNGARKDYAHVIGDFNNWKLSNDEKSQMTRDDAAGVWWITLSGLDATKEYAFQYYVGKTGEEPIRVADAYSRKVLDPANDQYISSSTYPENKTYPQGGIGIVSTFKIQQETFNFTPFTTPKTDNLVIYEMLFRDFTTSGDINGALAKLDYLKSLGVNAIELMPVQEFDGNDSWGYNPAFFFAMDKAYGTDRMYKQFIDECHKRGMAVIFDVVYNHATGANPFAKMWWNATANKTAANNPYFNVDAPHPYSVFHDFNHESTLVRDFVKRNLQFLLDEYNIDGFRFDLTKGFTQKKSSESNAHVYDASRIAILKDYNSAIKAVKADALVILEHFADDKEETELANAGMMVWRNNNEAFMESAMGWKDKTNFNPVYYGTSSRPANSLVSYMESHDEERAAYKQSQWGNGILKTDLSARMNQLSTNAAFFFTVPGPKMVWQFGEMGYDYSINSNLSGNISEDYRTSKKPIKWEYLDDVERKKLHDTYAKLINFRFKHSELFTSTATLDWKVTPAFWENGRFLTLSSFGNSKQVVVVGNFTNETINASITFPKTGTWYNYMNSSETLNVTSITMSVSVPANSFKMYSTFAP